MMGWAFRSGYRRLEWRCHAANAASRRAAACFGFMQEGILRQHCVAKGRSRDTACFSILDSEWPSVDAALREWGGVGVGVGDWQADGVEQGGY